MSEKRRIVKEGVEARKAVERGVNAAADIVKITLGPSGQNVLLDYGPNRTPRILNDGVTISEHIWNRYDLGPCEIKVAQAFIDAAKKTNDKVGDGTTTTAVIAQRLIREGLKRLSGVSYVASPASSAMALRREILDTWPKVVEELRSKSRPIKTQKDLEKVATVSVENPEYGKVISDIVWKVGKDGHVTVEDSLGYDLETEVVEGMFFPACTATPGLAELNERKEAIWERTWIIVTNWDITSFTQLDAPINEVINHLRAQKADFSNMRFVYFAPKFSSQVLDTILQANRTVMRFGDGSQTNVKVLPVKIPALTDDWMEDISHFVGGRFIDKRLGLTVEKMAVADFGKADKVTSYWDWAIVLGGSGKPKARLEQIKERMKHETVLIAKLRLERRVASLAAAVGIIRTGAATEIERNYIREKLIDGKEAAKAALEEGVVKGGGLALFEASKKFKGSILESALKAPYEQIQANAGGMLEIGPEITDPLKVVRVALENACSVAAQFLTIGAISADNIEPDIREIADAIKGKLVMEKVVDEASRPDPIPSRDGE